MRRSASEILRILEMRIARLENRVSSEYVNGMEYVYISVLAKTIAREIQKTNRINIDALSREIEKKLVDFFLGFKEFEDEEDLEGYDSEKQRVSDFMFGIKKIDNELEELNKIKFTVVVHTYALIKEVDFLVVKKSGRYRINRS